MVDLESFMVNSKISLLFPIDRLSGFNDAIRAIFPIYGLPYL